MTNSLTTGRLALAQGIADSFAELPGVEAIALGGSIASGQVDPDSDIDLYIYAAQAIPVPTRARLIHQRASRAEVNNNFAEPGDEWIEAASGIAVDLMYRHPVWIEEQLDRVLCRHEASLGYSTAFWHNIRYSIPLFDRSGWFGRLQALAKQPYPEDLVQAIVAKNHPLLRNGISSWLNQLEKVVERGDLVAANQNVANLLASYLDILFAINRMTHPGGKRLLKLAADCTKKPPKMEEQVRALLQAVCSADRQILIHAGELLDDLDRMLLAEGFSTS